MTDQTLMTDAATQEGASTSEETQAAATGAEGEGSQQVEGDQSAGVETPEAKGDSDDTKPEGAPESYEFVAPEGATLDDQVIGVFSEVAKELDLPQDQAQKVIDKVAPVIAARQQEQIAAAQAAWADETRADPEIGGAKLDENLGVAKQAMTAFASPGMRALLHNSGLGNHPEVIRTFFNIGKAIREDGFVQGGGNGGETKTAQSFYSASNMNP